MLLKLSNHTWEEHKVEINNCCFSQHEYNKACWLIESRCNFNCEFCFHNQFESDRQLLAKKECDYSEIISCLHKNKIEHVILSGGEPLLSPNLFYIIYLLEENGFTVSISTNAALATPDFCNRLKNTAVRKLTVNLASICDKDGRISKGPLYNYTTRGIQNIISSGFVVTLNNILHISTTKETLIQNINYSERLGAQNISFTVPVCETSCEGNKSSYYMDISTICKIKNLLEEIEYELSPTIKIIFNHPDCDSKFCPANKKVFGIGLSGIFSTCLVKQYQEA